METESQRERDVMSNHIPFLVLKSGNISRKFVTKKMRSCDKNFGQLQLGVKPSFVKVHDLMKGTAE